MTAPMQLLPSLSRHDPLSTSEGTLDPLGLYQIADQLAIALVPAVRERMVRIRFLTAMTVGAAVVEDVADRQQHTDVSPQLVWEWLVVAAMIRQLGDAKAPPGIPGSQVTRRALVNHGYLDAASYLKTPRIFGFHGAYKRLAIHLGLVDVSLAHGAQPEPLLDAWARDQGLSGFADAQQLLSRWRAGVERSLSRQPPRTDPPWKAADWDGLAELMNPERIGRRERGVLRGLLVESGDRPLGALPDIWRIGKEHSEEEISDQAMHRMLRKTTPQWRPLLDAIGAYEAFARALQDSFDALRDLAGSCSGPTLHIRTVLDSEQFSRSSTGLQTLHQQASHLLNAASEAASSATSIFEQRFFEFGLPRGEVELAMALLDHHDAIQRAKSAEGKRSWFDRLGPDQVHLRFPYRLEKWKPSPGEYVHPYRTRPILSFLRDIR